MHKIFPLSYINTFSTPSLSTRTKICFHSREKHGKPFFGGENSLKRKSWDESYKIMIILTDFFCSLEMMPQFMSWMVKRSVRKYSTTIILQSWQKLHKHKLVVWLNCSWFKEAILWTSFLLCRNVKYNFPSAPFYLIYFSRMEEKSCSRWDKINSIKENV